MNEKVRSSRRRSAVLAAAGVVAAWLAGCQPERSAARSPRSGASAADEKVLCVDDYVRSIWKGENLGGPDCADHAAYADDLSNVDHGRIERVCERTEIRTILSGEVATPFTRAGCARYAHSYQQDTIARACTAASRTSRAREEDLNPVQSAACEQSLRQAQQSKARASGAADSALVRFFRKAPAELSAVALTAPSDVPDGPPAPAPEAAPAESPSVAAAEPASVAAAEPASVAAEPASVAAEPANVAAPEPGSVAGAAPVSVAAAADKAACEDRFIESIWKGQDLSGGSACAVYVGADGYAPSYRIARIQNVCDGATIRSKRLGEALPAFTLEACSGALRARPSPEAPAAGGSNGTADSPDAPKPGGLDPAAIASTVDAHWRSIGRDCLAVAPSSRSLPAPANTQVTVIITVAASGQVRNVSARAGARRQLESCIENSVRSWRFPSASSDTVITIPLMFAGQ